jgi:hypothetical protein
MCCIAADPVEDKTGKIRTFNGQNTFQASMMEAPCAGGISTFCW